MFQEHLQIRRRVLELVIAWPDLTLAEAERMADRSITVALTDTRTGVTREFPFTGSADPGAVEFHWSEGNYGCDCNRALFFARAGGEPADPGDFPCGEGRYRADVRDAVTGEVLYRDAPTATARC